MRVVCIDFETANRFVGSICSVGIAIIEDDLITDTKYWLVKPHMDHNYFDPFHVMIHGIKEEDVKDALEFDSVYAEIEPLLKDAVVVAHNASFDMSALSHVLDVYQIPYPEVEYICTYKTAIRTWSGLENYKLNTICKFLMHDFAHHNALEDAIACGKVLLAALAEKGLTSVDQLPSSIGMKPGRLYKGGHISCSISLSKRTRIEIKAIVPEGDPFDPDHELYEKRVVFTGILISMPRREAMQRVVDVGGLIEDHVNEMTDYLVLGMKDYTKFTNGRVSSKTRIAKRLISMGRQIQIIDEAEFLRML